MLKDAQKIALIDKIAESYSHLFNEWGKKKIDGKWVKIDKEDHSNAWEEVWVWTRDGKKI